uniref:Uncharacterized protein n=1 Tax=Siphoviridae sp. ctC6Q17 TaxID=2827271 RepID=A0A8S5R421_9CAUD|nr:MAG TPA: hypothetical protein [Siphoviridae sp. ctC6Q17]DAM41218.1 MAG TPA: hypothetical protein [Caudoviricetes sp.]
MMSLWLAFASPFFVQKNRPHARGFLLVMTS